jgi:hypothetical protein
VKFMRVMFPHCMKDKTNEISCAMADQVGVVIIL